MSYESPSPCLSRGLAAYVSEEMLDANFERDHDAMMGGLKRAAPSVVECVGAAKEVLLQVPLVHATRDPLSADSIQNTGIMPRVERPADSHHNTEQLDVSLGLDHYAFMHYGNMRHGYYGSTKVLVNPELLQSSKVIVTDGDITTYVRQDHKLPFREQPEPVQRTVENHYFGRMYRGDDWLTLTAIRALRSALVTRGDPVSISGLQETEVKHLGTVPSDMITAQTSPEGFAEREDAMLADGTMSPAISSWLHYDKPGADFRHSSFQAGREIWRNILGIDISEPPYVYPTQRSISLEAVNGPYCGSYR